LAQRRPTRSSAVDFRDRWYLSWLTPWLVGLPKMRNWSQLQCSQPSAMVPRHTVGGTLGDWALATSTANTSTVDNIALLGLVPKTASLVGAGWTGGAVDDVQLSKLYFALSAKFNECIAGASSRCPPSPNVMRRPRERIQSIGVRSKSFQGSKYLTSQHRTRRRNRSTSDCFFFRISSTYLEAPIVTDSRRLDVVEVVVEDGCRSRVVRCSASKILLEYWRKCDAIFRLALACSACP
jgi:hypothetical protein